MKPAVDEMFPEGTRPYVDLDEAGGSTGLLMDLAANEKAVHADFFNDFEDLFDNDDIQADSPRGQICFPEENRTREKQLEAKSNAETNDDQKKLATPSRPA
ncbi:hypothetical protein R6Z07F_019275 [Ovis aries]